MNKTFQELSFFMFQDGSEANTTRQVFEFQNTWNSNIWILGIPKYVYFEFPMKYMWRFSVHFLWHFSVHF